MSTLGHELLAIAAGVESSRSWLSPGLRDRYVPLVKKLPSAAMMRELIHIYWVEFNWYASVLTKCYFDQLFNSWLPVRELIEGHGDVRNVSRDLQFFPALLFQTLAVAYQFLPLESVTAQLAGIKSYTLCDDVSEYYSTMGVELMNILGRHQSCITTIQHELMRSCWLKNVGRGLESWHALCDAIRQAQSMGLHLQDKVQHTPGDRFEDTLARLWYDEYKRRIWMTLFTWDSHTALILGRPRTINWLDCTIKDPVDCDFPAEIALTTASASVTSGGPPSMYTSAIFHYFLGQKVHEMMTYGLDKPHPRDYTLVWAVHRSVIDCLNNLPPAMRPSNADLSWDEELPDIPRLRSMIGSSAFSFLIALHRAHAPHHVQSRQAAMYAALDTLACQEAMFQSLSPVHYRMYTLSFYTVDAGTYLAAATIKYLPTNPQMLQRVYDALLLGVKRLETIKERNPTADSGAQILAACCRRIQAHYQTVDTRSGGAGRPDLAGGVMPDPGLVISVNSTTQQPAPISSQKNGLDVEDGSQDPTAPASYESLGQLLSIEDISWLDQLDGFGSITPLSEGPWQSGP